jgi:chromosome segregation ATPase
MSDEYFLDVSGRNIGRRAYPRMVEDLKELKLKKDDYCSLMDVLSVKLNGVKHAIELVEKEIEKTERHIKSHEEKEIVLQKMNEAVSWNLTKT